MTNPSVTAIVPCFNEEMFVASTISCLLLCPTINEIIAVDDGSTDQTVKILRLFTPKIKLLACKKNLGKGKAVAEGLKKAKGDIIVFTDAHHLNIEDKHIQSLIRPLIKGTAESVLGTTIVYPPDPFWRLTGFRAYWKNDLLPLIPEMETTRYGLEAYLNDSFKNKKRRVLKIKKLVHILKQQKMSPVKAFKEYITEFSEVGITLAKNKGIDPEIIEKVLDPRKIKTVRSLRLALKKINNKSIMNVLKKYIVEYLSI